jgi:hypothetical protein
MPEPQTICLKSWKEFPSTVESILEENDELGPELLFRGLGNAHWQLQTTLERSPDADASETLLSYYRRISRTQPIIESLTNRRWDALPSWLEFEKFVQSPTLRWIDSALANNPAIYEYLIYLRHHGFPSPILDWTVSPYVAAAFAFDVMENGASEVAIWVYGRNKIQAYGRCSLVCGGAVS